MACNLKKSLDALPEGNMKFNARKLILYLSLNMEKKVTIGTVCFLIDEAKDSVLLLERSREPMKSKYTGVGGKTHFEEDIKKSCIREIKEETGYEANELKLKGIVKTLLQGKDSSWILFVYTCSDFSGEETPCDEGELHWVKSADIYKTDLIGFIREILPTVLLEDGFIERCMLHDIHGNLIGDTDS